MRRKRTGGEDGARSKRRWTPKSRFAGSSSWSCAPPSPMTRSTSISSRSSMSRSRRIVAFEALARWRHPVRGPGFAGRIHPDRRGDRPHGGIGRGRAAPRLRCLRLVAGRHHRFGQPLPVAVSQRKYREGDRRGASERQSFARNGSTSRSPSRRCSTIAATCAARSTPCAARGLRVSLDDFGTGYSSLSYLLSFPLDRIKIDRSFTIGLGIQERASILVESVAAMSRKLGMTVLIEGVETERQMRIIETLGTIAEVQGFLFSPPVPAVGRPALARPRKRQEGRGLTTLSALERADQRQRIGRIPIDGAGDDAHFAARPCRSASSPEGPAPCRSGAASRTRRRSDRRSGRAT